MEDMRFKTALAWLIGDVALVDAAHSLGTQVWTSKVDEVCLCELGEDLFYEARAIGEARWLDGRTLVGEPDRVPSPPAMSIPSPKELAALLQDLTHQYARANQGSEVHPLGKATVVGLQEVMGGALPPGVLQGYGITFEDGSTYLVNVHAIPRAQPK